MPARLQISVLLVWLLILWMGSELGLGVWCLVVAVMVSLLL